jgi:hypothetical protein
VSEQLEGDIVDSVEAPTHLLVDDPVLSEGKSRVEPLLQLLDVVLYYECLDVSPSLLVEVYLRPVNSCVHHLLEVVLIREVQSLPLACVQLESLVPAPRVVSKGTAWHHGGRCLHYEVVLTLARYHQEVLSAPPYLYHLLAC